ncbi:MAG TPA: hypothetical protein VHX62_04900 [Solirubrobacteraceae bacterium]|jgi:hypothetical protein|nr:hypothetical protein [Solirubrobacteraceae bacterium]
MHRHRLALRRASLALFLAGTTGLVLAACGGSSGTATGTAAGAVSPQRSSQAVAFSKCMRAHGVTNFPDPSAGGGIQISSSSGINPFSPSFKSAQSACRKLLPGGGPGAGPPSEQAKRQMLQISQCMRSHGITGFPDPTTTPPGGPGNFALVMGRGGVYLAIPNSLNPQSPAFMQAAKACNFGGPRR